MRFNRDTWLVAYRAFSDLAGKSAFFLVTILAARRLSTDGFGIFSLGTTLGWMAAVVTDFGMQLHLAREVAKRPDEAGRLLRSWLHLRLLTAGSAFVVVSMATVVAIARGAGSESAIAIFLFVAVYLLSGLIEFLYYLYRGLGRSDLESTLTLWQRIGTLLLAGLVLLWRPSVVAVGAAMLVPVSATLAYSLWRAARLTGTETSDKRQVLGDRSNEFWHEAAPIGIGIVLSALYFRIDLFLIEFWRGTGEVALYNAVFRLVEALRLFPAAVLAVALPALCRAKNTRPLFRISASVTGLGLATMAVGLLVANRLVPFIYGAEYATAVPAFQILLASFPLMSLNYALTHQLIGWNGHRAYAAICAAALVFNVALNARLIPALSVTGAAWTTLWTEVLVTVGCIAALWMGSPQEGTGDLAPDVVV